MKLAHDSLSPSTTPVIGISMGMSPRGCGALNSAPYYVPMVRYARAPRFCGMMSHSHLSATAPQLKRP